MENQQQIHNLRHEHIGAYIAIIGTLSDHGYRTELTGSAADDPDYRDIDLVLRPSAPSASQLRSLEGVIDEICATHDYEIFDRKIDHEMSYAGRLINARYQIGSDDVKFDLCYSPYNL